MDNVFFLGSSLIFTHLASVSVSFLISGGILISGLLRIWPLKGLQNHYSFLKSSCPLRSVSVHLVRFGYAPSNTSPRAYRISLSLRKENPNPLLTGFQAYDVPFHNRRKVVRTTLITALKGLDIEWTILLMLKKNHNWHFDEIRTN